ncbi:hypothetical protein GJ26_18445 [Vibrio cholerae]|nr:hypothetical protein GJ26_18445 [Vibrio cholerae]
MKLSEFKCLKFTFEFFPDGYLVERVENSAVSKSLKISKPRCFNVVGCSTLEVWFHKSGIIAVTAFSLSWILIAINLALIALSFGSQRHSFWRWTYVCLMLLLKLTLQVSVFKKTMLNNRLRN